MCNLHTESEVSLNFSGIVTEFEYVLIVFPLDFFVAVVL